MRIILKSEVENLGTFGDIVRVAPGYGRNYLIPRGMAAEATPGNLKQFEAEHASELRSLSPEAAALLAGTRNRLAGLVNATDPAGQKKAGNCKLPEGVCFVKASRALLEKV